MSIRSDKEAIARIAAGVGLIVRPARASTEKPSPVWDGRRASWDGLTLYDRAYELARWYLATDKERAAAVEKTPQCGKQECAAIAKLILARFGYYHEWGDAELDACAQLWRDGIVEAPSITDLEVEHVTDLMPVLMGTPDPMPPCDGECQHVAACVTESVCELPWRERLIPGWTGIWETPPLTQEIGGA